jgi:hypothetical protein
MDNINKEDFMPDKDFSEMTEEEKREYCRKLIHSSKAANAIAAFFDPKSGRTIRLSEFIERAGSEEEAIDKLVDIIDHTQSITLNDDDVHELIEKVKNGKATDQEKLILKSIFKETGFENIQHFQSAEIDILVDLIHHAQTRIGFDAPLECLITPISVIAMASLACSGDEAVSKYKDSSPTVLLEILNQIGNDIYTTWKDSCEEEIDTSLIILSLLHVASALAAKENMLIAKSTDIADLLGIELDDVDAAIHGSNNEEESAMDVLRDLFDAVDNPAKESKPPKIIELPDSNDDKIKKIKNFYKN